MADKGIIFSAPMVLALLDGRKTQTRRIITVPMKPDVNPLFSGLRALVHGIGRWMVHGSEEASEPFKVPYAVGDRLYVREANKLHEEHGSIIRRHVADGAKLQWGNREQAAWIEHYSREHCPSIHMPRWASRLTLIVTDVRVQRLQDISNLDAKAEGVRRWKTHCGTRWYEDYSNAGDAFEDDLVGAARFSFQTLWNSLHTADGERWQDNPWIVAITFDVQRGNIDQLDGRQGA